MSQSIDDGDVASKFLLSSLLHFHVARSAATEDDEPAVRQLEFADGVIGELDRQVCFELVVQAMSGHTRVLHAAN